MTELNAEAVIPNNLFLYFFSCENSLREDILYLHCKSEKKIRTMKKPLRTLRAKNLNSNLLNRIVGIAKRLHNTVESKLNALIYRLLDLPDDIYLNGGIQIPSPSISREEIDKLLFEAQERNLAFEAQIKSLNAEIDDFQRVIEEFARKCKAVLPEKS